MSQFKYLVFLIILLPKSTPAVPVVLDYVPSYNWYHGCSPTASANIMGYWDLHGYDNLFDASGWREVNLTENVRDHISSPEHNAKYDPRPDNPDLPVPTDTSIADFMHTSEGSLNMGWTYISNIDNALRDYPNLMGYTFAAQYVSRTWENYIAEIDAGNPLLINVDSNGDGSIDHSMTGIGYEDRGDDGLWYASYNTWHESETIDWYQFRPQSSKYRFGLHSMINIHPIDDPIDGMPISYIDFSISEPDPGPNPAPEPATILLVGPGLIALVGFRRKFKKSRSINHQ
jgi:hypothetical protein